MLGLPATPAAKNLCTDRHTHVTRFPTSRPPPHARTHTQTITFWSGIDCSSLDLYGLNATVNATVQEECESCKAASGSSIATAVMGAVTQLLQINGDLGRSTVAGDMNCAKAVGVLSGIWGVGE